MTDKTQGRRVAAVFFPVADLVKWDRNPRKITPEAVAKVARSIEQLGWGAPCLARESDQRLIAGHTRLQAAQQLGLIEVPVRFIECSDAQADLLAIADNRLGEEVEWDQAALAEILRGVPGEQALLTGFGADELQAMLGEFNVGEGQLPDLQGARDVFQQITFTLHDDQAEVVKQAMEVARQSGLDKDPRNKNSNGNVLFAVCEAFMRGLA